MKKLLLLIAMLGCLQVSAGVKGDINGDENVDVSDLNIVINGILDKDPYYYYTDVNLDGVTDVTDLNIVINIILGKDKYYVDLGLPSGTLWAECNVGAENKQDYGLYFAWGETVGYANGEEHDFSWANYKWMTPGHSEWNYVTKYTHEDNMKQGIWYNGDTYVGTTVDGVTYKNLTELLPEDDAATANWGPGWRMPSGEEIEELLDPRYTYTSGGSCLGVYGQWIFSISNGKSIFLPAADFRHSWPTIGNYETNWLVYMTRDQFKQGPAASHYNRDLSYSFGKFSANSAMERYYGRPVRAVRVEKAKR